MLIVNAPARLDPEKAFVSADFLRLIRYHDSAVYANGKGEKPTEADKNGMFRPDCPPGPRESVGQYRIEIVF